MSDIFANLIARMELESTQFQREIARVNARQRDFSQGAREASAESRNFEQRLSGAAASAGKYVTAIAGVVTAVAAAAAGAYALARNLADTTAEMEEQARIAGASLEIWQGYAFGARLAGVEADKLADIAKDVREKIGEFVATGGGGAKDFFEQIAPKIGVTAERLQALSGPEVLIAVKTAMERANVPMAQQIFYLEGLASDSSKLIPLIKNSGAAWLAAANDLHTLNAEMSAADAGKLEDFDRQAARLGVAFDGMVKRSLMPAVDWLTKFSEEAAKLMSAVINDADPYAGVDTSFIREQVAAATAGIDNAKARLAELERFRNASWLSSQGRERRELEEQISALEELRGKYQPVLEMRERELEISRQAAEERKRITENAALIANQKAQEDAAKAADKAAQQAEKNAKSAAERAAAEQQKRLDDARGYMVELSRLDDTRAEQIAAWQADELAKLNEFLAKKAISQQQYTEGLAAIEREAAARNAEIEAADQEAWRKRAADRTEEVRRQVEDQYAIQQTSWDRYVESMRASAEDTDQLWADTLGRFSDNVAQAVTDAIYNFESLGDLGGSIVEALGRQIVQTLVEMATQRMVLWGIERTIQASTSAGYVAQVAGQASAASILAGINAYASTAAIPIIGPAAAPAAASAALAFTAPAAGAAAAAAASSMAGIAHGGLDYVPKEATYLLDKGERVLSPRQNRDLDQFINDGGGGFNVTIIDNGSGGRSYDVQQLTARDVEIIINDRVPKLVAAEVTSPNSRFNRALTSTRSAPRRL